MRNNKRLIDELYACCGGIFGRCAECEFYGQSHCVQKLTSEAAEVIERNEKRVAKILENAKVREAKLKRGWISVEEELPPTYRDVLVKDTPVGIVIGWRTQEGWLIDCHGVEKTEGVTHWMELPEPPKGD